MASNNRLVITAMFDWLQPVLLEIVKQVFPDNWQKEVAQAAKNREKKKDEPEEDIVNLLYVITNKRNKLKDIFFESSDFPLVSQLIEDRNKWAHGNAETFSNDDTHRILDTALRLLKSISENNKLSIDVEKQRTEIDKQKQDIFRILWQEQNRREILDKPISEKEEATIKQNLDELLKRIPFENAYLLNQALTSTAYSFEKKIPEDNEQLEFLGDALLTFLSGEFLYKKYRDLGEGKMTILRSNLVSNKQLAKFAEELNLGKWMLLGKGEKKEAGEQKESLLSNCFEAVVGAYYLDSGIDAVRDFVNKKFFEKIIPNLLTIEEDNPKIKTESKDQDNPKGRLQELVCSPEFNRNPDNESPVYDTSKIGGVDHEPRFVSTVSIAGVPYAEGEGSSKKEAEKNAAEKALKILNGFSEK